MDFTLSLGCSDPNKTHTTTMATTMTLSNEYWTATALGATNQTIYAKDGCGVTCIVTQLVSPGSWIPCEPWCQDCGHPEGNCNKYTDDSFTGCRGYRCGRWFNEEQGEWIEAEKSIGEEDEEKSNQHAFGICTLCKEGLDTVSDFKINYCAGTDKGAIMCNNCNTEQNQKQNRCTNCLDCVKSTDIISGAWDSHRRKLVVFFCSNC